MTEGVSQLGQTQFRPLIIPHYIYIGLLLSYAPFMSVPLFRWWV